MAVRSMTGTVTLNNVVFANDKAQGGPGSTLGGFGLGGGFYALSSTVSMTGVTFTNDLAEGGHTDNGSGSIPGMQFADGIGGGSYTFQSTALMNVITATNNTARGGYALQGQGGGGVGGGLHFEESSVSGHDWNLRNNTAQGGTGATAGLSYGGGFEFFDTQGLVDRGFVINNTSLGGLGTNGGPNGPPQGGGIAFFDHSNAGLQANVVNFVIAGNHDNMANLTASTLNGGGGGGVSDQGQTVGFYQTTFADNTVNTPDLHGAAVLVFGQGTPFNPTLTLHYDIFANEAQPTSAVHGFGGSTIDETRNLFYNNTTDDNSGGATNGPNGNATYNFDGNAPNVSGNPLFTSAGSPNFDYTLQAGSPAIDNAAGSTVADDAFNHARVAAPDIGAVEHLPPTLAFAPPKYVVGQQDGTVTLTVTRGGGATTSPLDVNLQTINGTATSGTDYTAANTNVHFNANQTSQTVSIPILYAQPNPGLRTFSAVLTGPSDPSTLFPSGQSAAVSIYGANADGPGMFDPTTGAWYLRNLADGRPAVRRTVRLRRPRLEAAGGRLGRERQRERRRGPARPRTRDPDLVSEEHERRGQPGHHAVLLRRQPLDPRGGGLGPQRDDDRRHGRSRQHGLLHEEYAVVSP